MFSRRDLARWLTFLVLAGALALFMVAGARAASPRAQLEQMIYHHDAPTARKQGLRVISVRCALAGASLPHVYYCEETWQTPGRPRACNVAAYHFYRGKLEHWGVVWACGTPPPYIPPFPGDASAPRPAGTA